VNAIAPPARARRARGSAARAAAPLPHDASAAPRRRYETTNHLWLILEYCVGGDLMSLLRQDVRLPESSVHDFARDMVVALQYLHSNSIIYCDIKVGAAVRARDWEGERGGRGSGSGNGRQRPSVGWRAFRRQQGSSCCCCGGDRGCGCGGGSALLVIRAVYWRSRDGAVCGGASGGAAGRPGRSA
jgi:hypothetical protein